MSDRGRGGGTQLASEIGARMDSIPYSKFHRRVFWLIAGGLFFDGFDIYLAAGVLAALVATGWATPQTTSFFVSATFAGLFIGAMFAGYAGDKFGRKKMYQFNLLLFGGAAVLSFFAPNYAVLVILRFLMSMGMGAEIVLGYATFSEFVPPHLRGRMNSLLALFTNGALFIASITSLLVIPTLGWRYMFLIVGIPTLIIWWLRRVMPESPRWLLTQQRPEEALSIVGDIERECGAQTTRSQGFVLEERPETPASGVRNQSPEAGTFRDLFRGRLMKQTVFAMGIMVVLNIGVYGFNVWLPTALVDRGFEIGGSLGITTIITAGAVVGAVVTAFLSDKFSSRWYISIISILIALSACAFTVVNSNVAIAISGFVFMAFLYCFVVMAWAVYVPMLFPTNVRLRGSGLANAAGRFVLIFMPYIIAGVLLPTAGFSGVVWTIAALFLIVAVAAVFFGMDVQGRSLEDLEEEETAGGTRDVQRGSAPQTSQS